MLKQRYAENELTIDRLANVINNPRDYEYMGKLIVAIYETAYLKAVSEHQDILKKLGITVDVVASKEGVKPGDNIFKKNAAGNRK